MGRNWDQPPTSDILIDDEYALMTKATFDRLAEYSCSTPSGVYPGKMWRVDNAAYHSAKARTPTLYPITLAKFYWYEHRRENRRKPQPRHPRRVDAITRRTREEVKMTATQLLLPILPPFPDAHLRWMEAANAAYYYDKHAVFYPFKSRLLRRFAIPFAVSLSGICQIPSLLPPTPETTNRMKGLFHMPMFECFNVFDCVEFQDRFTKRIITAR